MIRWCAFCQRYLGETAPHDRYDVTHGVCERCAAAGAGGDADAARRLASLRAYFQKVARCHNAPSFPPGRLLEEGRALGIDPFDLLIGVLQPALYRMGRLWASSAASVSEEHRLTAVCADVIALVRDEQLRANPLRTEAHPRFLLANVEGNTHTLGVQIVELFLLSRGIAAQAHYPGLPASEIRALAASLQPRIVGLSCATTDQLATLPGIAQELAGLLTPPTGVAGGFAVLAGPGFPTGVGLQIAPQLESLLAR